MAFCTACCVRLASVTVAVLSLSFLLAVLTRFRDMGDHAKDPLACGLPSYPIRSDPMPGIACFDYFYAPTGCAQGLVIASYYWLPEGVGALARAVGTLCCILLLSLLSH